MYVQVKTSIYFWVFDEFIGNVFDNAIIQLLQFSPTEAKAESEYGLMMDDNNYKSKYSSIEEEVIECNNFNLNVNDNDDSGGDDVAANTGNNANNNDDENNKNDDIVGQLLELKQGEEEEEEKNRNSVYLKRRN